MSTFAGDPQEETEPAALGASSAPEASPGAVPEAPTEPDGWDLVALIPYDGREPPAGASDALALAVWCAVSALWHPSLLARASALPRIEPVDSPSPPGRREIRVIASGALDRLPSGYRVGAEDAGTALIESGTDRAALIREIHARLSDPGLTELVTSEGMISTACDFLALGTAHWMVRDLASAMGHPDAVDRESLCRELKAGACAWQAGDYATAVNRLRAGFEILTQARERFYPVDAYCVDLCLIDPSMPAGVLADSLANPVAISFIAPAQAIERQAQSDPDRIAALTKAITDGWADVVGGPYTEAEDPLLPLESALWQFRRANHVYRTHLDDRSVETYARRRFGLYTQLPQLAKRFGFRFALHMAFDAGRFPVRAETKRLWESPDGSNLEALLRPPLAADRPTQGWLLPWRLATSMKLDHVAAVPLVHWPLPVAPWYLDLRRVAGYSAVLARWTTVNDFFHLTDRPYETFRPEPDQYQTPYLAQAVARRDPEPISRLARHHRLRSRFEAACTVAALAQSIASASPTAGRDSPSPALELHANAPSLGAAEELLETERYPEAATALDWLEPYWSGSLARSIMAAGAPSNGDRPGYLVFNPLNIPRRAAVSLPEAALDLRPEGALRAAQFIDDGVYAIVDLPPLGYAWVPRETDLSRPAAVAQRLTASGRKLKNESIEIEIDAATGGIRSLAASEEPAARLAQQLVMTGLVDAEGKPATSQMKLDKFEIDYGGPALVQATARGRLVDPRQGDRLAGFVQRYRLWSGRPILEIEIALDQLDGSWLKQASEADPWSVYLACRWAWPDPTSMLRRTVFYSPELVESERPETPDAIDISTRKQRTALLFGGLPYHHKHGGRMLDTLLLSGAESERTHTLGVVLDLEHPFQAAQDLISPALVATIDRGPPEQGARGWLAQIDNQAVAVTHIEFKPASADGHGWGLIIHLLETGGRASRCRLRLFRNPLSARQTDFQGETIIDLTVDGDGVHVDLTPHELARIEVTMGQNPPGAAGLG
jgi:alpha-mannosidase